tara:strand:+ start:250 stop:1176 length:927 start_codon:yes stop_codon:yes gene_type:complete
MFNYNEKIKNLILKFYTSIIDYLPKYSTSENYWNKNLVDTPLNGFTNIKDSIEHLKWRNIQYLNSMNIINLKQYDNKIILDFGCGPGNDLINISYNSKPKKILAYDVSKKAILLARKRTKLHKLKVKFLEGSEEKLIIPSSEKSIDIIHTMGVLHHIENTNAVFREFKRVLKKDGFVQAMVYNRDSVWYHLHVAYEIKIKRGLWPKKSLDYIFSKTVDGFKCPVAFCYNQKEFSSLCKKNGFSCELLGISTSLFEMEKLKFLWEALRHKKLNQESRDFLENISFSVNGEPIYKKKIAGINSYYKLKKI